nr:unnamed protein product [Digitaria exilis]
MAAAAAGASVSPTLAPAKPTSISVREGPTRKQPAAQRHRHHQKISKPNEAERCNVRDSSLGLAPSPVFSTQLLVSSPLFPPHALRRQP